MCPRAFPDGRLTDELSRQWTKHNAAAKKLYGKGRTLADRSTFYWSPDEVVLALLKKAEEICETDCIEFFKNMLVNSRALIDLAARSARALDELADSREASELPKAKDHARDQLESAGITLAQMPAAEKDPAAAVRQLDFKIRETGPVREVMAAIDASRQQAIGMGEFRRAARDSAEAAKYRIATVDREIVCCLSGVSTRC